MPRPHPKGKQPSVEPAEPAEYEEDVGEGASGEIGGELVPTKTIKQPSIPEFSAEQVHRINSMQVQMTTMMDAKIDMQDRRFAAKLDEQSRSIMAAIQRMQQLFSTAENTEKSQPNPPATQPSSQPATPATSEDKRWRHDDVGDFHGPPDDVFAFTDRLTSIAASKGPKVVQANIVTVLKDVAYDWYHYELTNVVKWALSSADSINPWCNALIERFRPTHEELMSQLESTRYTRKDAANKKDATAYIQSLLRIGKGLDWSQSDTLMTAFHHFEPGLQRDLDPPIELTQFIRQVQIRQAAWFQIYVGYGAKSQVQQQRTQSYSPAKSPQYQQPPYRPSAYPPRPYPTQSSQQRQITDKPYEPAPRPRVYYAEQEEDDYIYDAPSDAWVAIPEHGPGHTPRRWGNTHDVGGNEAMANWTAAGDDHRCTHEGCTHYH